MKSVKSGEKWRKVGKSEKSGEKWQKVGKTAVFHTCIICYIFNSRYYVFRILDIIKFLLSSFIKDHLGLLVQVMYDNYCPAITC